MLGCAGVPPPARPNSTVEITFTSSRAILDVVPDRDPPPDLPTILHQQARDLEHLIAEAQRILGEVRENLSKLRHAGDPSAPNQKA